MAEKKRTKPVDAMTEETNAAGTKTKKILIVVLVILVVIAISAMVDNSLRNPPLRGQTDAMNSILGDGANVIGNNPEITYDTPVEVNVLDMEKVNGKDYYPVEVIAGEAPNTKRYGPYYVAVRNSKVYVKDAVGELVPYGV